MKKEATNLHRLSLMYVYSQVHELAGLVSIIVVGPLLRICVSVQDLQQHV